MNLALKQLVKEITNNKIFTSLLLLLTVLTSLSFFFVIFSIDGNMSNLNALQTLTENQQLYKNALSANTSLAYTFLISTIGLTAFVFIMFFYRFFRSNKRQIGCLKALGFKDSTLRLCFIVFTAILSMIGAILGLIGGYFLSDVLINANTQTYFVTDLVKDVSLQSLAIGLGLPILIFCLSTVFSYTFVRGKEPGLLIAGNADYTRFTFFLRIANNITRVIPVKNKFPYRIALRKPLAILLIFVAVMSFSVCMILGRSLNISSQKVTLSQTTGHNYEYDIQFDEYQIDSVPDNAIPYLESHAKLSVGHYEIEHMAVGLYNLNALYELKNMNDDLLPLPEPGTTYINPGLHETYGVNIGDTLIVSIEGTNHSLYVADVATNAKSASIYLNAEQLAEMLDVPVGTYNGILSMEQVTNGFTTTRAERIEELNRNEVSSNISAVINQTIGGIIGAILIFLALYVNFQDNSRDMLILHMMGYKTKAIRKLMIDVYMPIVWAAFLLTLAPSIWLARSIQRSLSISTNEYMPFGTNAVVVITVFAILNLIYWLVQILFGLGIKRTIAKEEISELIYAE